MRLVRRLQTVKSIFLDTAPVIYYVEANPGYLNQVAPVFDMIDNGSLRAVTSPVTLAECLVGSYRADQTELARQYRNVIMRGRNTSFTLIGEREADRSAYLRAVYHVSLPDSLQIACALNTGCEAFLTNDLNLRRVTEIEVLALDMFDH